VKTPLVYTYYTFNNSGSPCNVKDKIKLSTKKTAYAKLSTATETEPGSFYGCSSPVTFYGDVYDLTAKKVTSGTEDSFVSTLTSKIVFNGTKYDATLNLDLTVIIE